jgi:hypothetical protein
MIRIVVIHRNISWSNTLIVLFIRCHIQWRLVKQNSTSLNCSNGVSKNPYWFTLAWVANDPIKPAFGTFWSFNGADATMMRRVNISHSKSSAFPVNPPGPSAEKAAFVGQFCQWISLIHELT